MNLWVSKRYIYIYCDDGTGSWIIALKASSKGYSLCPSSKAHFHFVCHFLALLKWRQKLMTQAQPSNKMICRPTGGTPRSTSQSTDCWGVEQGTLRSGLQITNHLSQIWGGGDSSVVRAPDSRLKGRGFESLLERRENFLLQGRLSVLTLISVSVPPPVLPQ